MAAPKEIIRLVENFDRNLTSYRSGAYNETQVRPEFIDPFFEVLGWDVDNKAGLRRSLQGRHPRGRHQGRRRHQGPGLLLPHRRHAQVLRRGQEAVGQHQGRPSPGLPAPPLCLVGQAAAVASSPTSRSSPSTTAASSRTRPTSRRSPGSLPAPTTSIAEQWDEIAGIFSKEAVLKGSFDKFAEEQARARSGTAEVDAAFLKEIERWRDAAGQEHRPAQPAALSQRELNFAVQRTIDRIIFLRICEDRGIETRTASFRGC